MLSSLPSSCRRGATTAALALAIVGCERPGTIDHPTVSGRLVQATDVAARAAPLRVRAYELRFSDASEADVQARRAALVVEFAGSDGDARGFVEWARRVNHRRLTSPTAGRDSRSPPRRRSRCSNGPYTTSRFRAARD